MKMKLRVMALATVAMVLVAWTGSADEDDPASISDIMVTAHKGKESLLSKIGKAVKAGELDGAKADADALLILAVDLGKNEAPKGDADSWTKLTGEYHEGVEALVDALGKGDGDAAAAAHKGLTMACMGCHVAHRP